MKKLITALSVLLGTLVSFSAQANPPLGMTINKYFGEHVPLFVFKKTIHPQNIVIVYTKMDRNCRIVYDRQTGAPTFGLYWLDDGVRYDAAPHLASQLLSRMPVEDVKGDPTSFYVRLNDLGRVNHDLADERLLIKSERHGNTCIAGAYVMLKDKKLVRITSTLTDASINFFTFDTDIRSLTVVGHEAGEPNSKIIRKFTAGKKRYSAYGW